MKLIEHIKSIFLKDTIPIQSANLPEEIGSKVNALIIDNSEAFAIFLAKKIGTTIPPIIVKDNTVDEILNIINIRSEGAKGIFLSSHLLFKGINWRHQFGGIDLLKHIRLTESFADVRCLPIIVFGWDHITSYVRPQIDNIVLLAPGCSYLQLPITTNVLFSTLQETEQFASIDQMKSIIKDYIRLTVSDGAASKHDYRNKVGVYRLFDEFVIESESVSNPFSIPYNKDTRGDLWFKKIQFLESFNRSAVEKEIIRDTRNGVQSLTIGKRFIYIDDQHRDGWSYVLYTGLTNDHLPVEFFDSTERVLETPNRRFTIIDAYDVAMSMFVERKNAFETHLQLWAGADWKLNETNQSLRIAREKSFTTERLYKETARKLSEAEKNVKACEISYLESRNSFREKTKAFAERWAEIETGSADMPDIAIEDKKYQEGLETLNAARRDYVTMHKSYESAKDNFLKLQADQVRSQQGFEAARILFNETKQEYENAKKAYDDINNTFEEIFPWSIVFLDLRLVKLEDETKHIELSGGVRLLNELKLFDPSIPIIIFTASEKALSYEVCMELGADAYWMKGISGGQQLWQNIGDCLEATYLKEIWLKIRKVDMKKEWNCFLLKENGTLESRVLTKENIERKQIVKLLQDSFFLLRHKSNRCVQAIGSYDINAEVALNMGLIQEIRYREGSEGAKIDGKTWDKLIRANEIHRDEQEVIRRLRNTAVHAFELRRSGNIRTDSVGKNDALNAFQFTLDSLLRNP